MGNFKNDPNDQKIIINNIENSVKKTKQQKVIEKIMHNKQSEVKMGKIR